jgi:hypothetical protein
MKILDVNLLLYAVNTASPRHARAKAWLDEALSSTETVALPWVVILGFLRLSTSPRVLTRPLATELAVGIVDAMSSRPNVELIDPGPDHWAVLRGLLGESGTGGNLTTDAHLAALAIESGATLCSSDADFGRFRQLRWENPLRG